MIRLAVEANTSDTVTVLRRVADGLEGQIEDAVAAVSGYLNDALKHEAPVGKIASTFDVATRKPRQTGTGRDSIRFDLDGLHADFMAVDYFRFVIGGTEAHLITGNPTLAFFWDKAGGLVAFRSVKHPGTKPNDFREPALQSTSRQADAELEKIADWVARMAA